MDRRRFLKSIGLIGTATTVSPSLWFKIISYFKPKPTTEELYQRLMTIHFKQIERSILFGLRETSPVSILRVISEKFGSLPASDISDWKFRYPEFDEIPLR